MLQSMSSTAEVFCHVFLIVRICTQLTFTCSNLPIETLEEGVKYVRS